MQAIPAKNAIVLWSHELGDGIGDGAEITRLHVCRKDMQPAWTRDLPCSRGACSSEWLNGSWYETPMGLFIELAVTDGFVSKQAKIEALREFGKIAGQAEWTTMLLRELGERDCPHGDDYYDCRECRR